MKGVTYRKFLLIVLMVILALNQVDRLALGLLLQDIKASLHLSDTRLGLLTGIAFALFYSVMGIPIARWADRGNRVTIISLTTALWSVMVVLCGWAGSFLQLLLIRIGVAVGEAGCIPPALSLIADHFTRVQRPRAVSVYLLGGPLSVVIGYFLAGWLNQLYGWRMTFMILGAPGLVLALLTAFSLREPRRQISRTAGTSRLAADVIAKPSPAESPAPTLTDVFLTLWSIHTFRHLLFSFAVLSFFSTGIQQWQPAFFTRSYSLTTGQLGTWFAVIYGLGGILGTYWGGEWATRYAAADERRQLRAIAAICCIFAVLSAFIYLSRNHYVAFALMALAVVVIAAANPPMFATMQTLVPERMRAMSTAILYLSANLIGLGFGPLVVGALSDAFRPLRGEDSLRYALLAMCPGYWWGAWHLWRASVTVTLDLDRLHADQADPQYPHPLTTAD